MTASTEAGALPRQPGVAGKRLAPADSFDAMATFSDVLAQSLEQAAVGTQEPGKPALREAKVHTSSADQKPGETNTTGLSAASAAMLVAVPLVPSDAPMAAEASAPTNSPANMPANAAADASSSTTLSALPANAAAEYSAPAALPLSYGPAPGTDAKLSGFAATDAAGGTTLSSALPQVGVPLEQMAWSATASTSYANAAPVATEDASAAPSSSASTDEIQNSATQPSSAAGSAIAGSSQAATAAPVPVGSSSTAGFAPVAAETASAIQGEWQFLFSSRASGAGQTQTDTNAVAPAGSRETTTATAPPQQSSLSVPAASAVPGDDTFATSFVWPSWPLMDGKSDVPAASDATATATSAQPREGAGTVSATDAQAAAAAAAPSATMPLQASFQISWLAAPPASGQPSASATPSAPNLIDPGHVAVTSALQGIRASLTASTVATGALASVPTQGAAQHPEDRAHAGSPAAAMQNTPIGSGAAIFTPRLPAIATPAFAQSVGASRLQVSANASSRDFPSRDSVLSESVKESASGDSAVTPPQSDATSGATASLQVGEPIAPTNAASGVLTTESDDPGNQSSAQASSLVERSSGDSVSASPATPATTATATAAIPLTAVAPAIIPGGNAAEPGTGTDMGAPHAPSAQSALAQRSEDTPELSAALQTWNGGQNLQVHAVQSSQLAGKLGQYEMNIALQGESLGAVQVRTHLAGDQVGAAITVDRHDVHALLTSDLPALHQAFSERQLRVENVSVSQRSHTPDSGIGDSAARQQNQQTAPQHTYPQQAGGNSSPYLAGGNGSAAVEVELPEVRTAFDSNGRLSVRA